MLLGVYLVLGDLSDFLGYWVFFFLVLVLGWRFVCGGKVVKVVLGLYFYSLVVWMEEYFFF